MNADINRSGSLLLLFTCISTATVVCRIFRPPRFLLTKYAFTFCPSAAIVCNEFSRCLGLNMALGSDKLPSGSVLKVVILQQTVYYALLSCTIQWFIARLWVQLQLGPFQAILPCLSEVSLGAFSADTHLEHSLN